MNLHNTVTAVILAAGKGTRMKSELPKVAVVLNESPLLLHVLRNIESAGITRKVVVVGYRKDIVTDIAKSFPGVEFAEQTEQLGTGHAVISAEKQLAPYTGYTIVACGDAPLISPSSFSNLIEHHKSNGYVATVLSAKMENPTGYGRIIRSSDDGSLLRIVEEKDANPEEKAVNEVNTGTYCFNTEDLFGALKQIGNNNAQKEYYLTDVIKIFRNEGKKVGAQTLTNALESHGINSPDDLALAKQYIDNGLVGV
ncbi:MAG: sugar phosphate nucleotidyltransferase [Leptospira bouyouniensis]|uniref:UDP-N-acetylglucosamine diphosphorylase n=1 Tax=Leptospira bouyouniensis TaxID=2484911 RepID=A0ABY2L663_9LEPT|nr:sugar phosphate nucleotidyltransferase [Leptospira bouyouniensis]TGK51283.1 UDP-N-acetylglucosamine diphosphorylase [Leptospira bouyouniensis]